MSFPGVIVLATRNADKAREIREIFRASGPVFRTLDEFPFLAGAEENETTFMGNALKKAGHVSRALNLPALADDSGLEVDALNGEPGVRSARYSGKGASGNNALLLEKLKDVPAEKRTARFRCVAALCEPGKAPVVAEGRVEGVIGFEERGSRGFGYDPLFTPLGHDRTFAEMPEAEKNAMSHRGTAMRELKKRLEAV
jgi:XTP/dITP diphosphohydrolase